MNIWWVATTGDDVTGDGSYAAPFLTIERALTVFQNGDQVRIMDGTYNPTDSLIITGKDGSLFAENPDEVYIKPEKTTKHPACIVIGSADRFYLCGINILQADDTTGNLIGLFVENVNTFLAYTCSVSDFDIQAGVGYGIYARGDLGRIENCRVSNMVSNGSLLYGIKAMGGFEPVDCEVTMLSGSGHCDVFGIWASKT